MANSAAIIGAPTVSDVTEDTNLQVLIAAGLISISDANAGQAAFKTTVISTSGNLGSLTIAANGAYSYSVADSAVQYLGAGDTKIDTFTVTSVDGTTKKISFTIHGVNDTAVIGTASVADVTEDATKPTLTASGKISISDVDQGEAVFKTALISAAGNLGTLTLSTNGSYKYSVANGAVQYLGAGDTKVDTFTVTSDDGTVKQITFTIHGVNDAAVIGTPTVHDVTEDASQPLLIANGVISISDADQGQAAFKTSVISASGNLGSLTIATNGSYSYSVANSAVQYLGAGDTRTDTFTVTSLDGTTKHVSFTIHGVNDAAVIGTPTVHDVTEDGTIPLLYAVGTISISDADQGEAAFKAAIISGAGALGTLILMPNGAYGYFVADSAVQYLGANDTKVDTFTVTALDGTTKQISFTIHGTNDAAVIGTPTAHDVTEDSSATTLTATGSISISDADQGQAAFQTTVASAAGNLGTLTIAANGGYSYSVANSATQYLGANDIKTDTFTVASVDGTTKQITFTIHGVNDAAVIGTPTVHDVTADPSQVTLTATGSISVNDPDQGQSSFKTSVTSASGNLGHLTLATNGTYSYTVAESAAAQLGTGGTRVDTFTVTSFDGTTKQVTFTVHGPAAASHPASIGDPTVANVTEDTAVDGSGNLTATGSISITDVDAGQGSFQTLVTNGVGTLGTLVLAANGTYTYTVANSATQYLGVNDTKIETFTVTSFDGTSKVVSFTIHGTNDAAVISGASTASLTETNAVLTTGGALSATDIDSPTTFNVQSNVAGSNGYGHFSIGANGVWTYSTDTAQDEFVGGTTYTDSLTVKTADGTPQVITVSILGTNDAAVISGTSTANLTETNAVLTTGGALSATDVDNPASFVAQTNVAGSNGYGHFSIDAAGVWTYSTETAHDEFIGGTTYTDSLTVNTADGTPQVITVSILGANDAAVIGTPSVASVTEDIAADGSGNLTAAGTISITDVDQGQASFLTGVNGAASNLGSLNLAANGTYTYTVANSATQYLGANDTRTDTFTVTSQDGTTKDVSFAIHGAQDAPTLTVTPTASGQDNASISLFIASGLIDTSNTLSIAVHDVPTSYKLNHGTQSDDPTVWLLTPAQLTGLALVPADGVAGKPGNFTLHVVASSSDGTHLASTSADIALQVSTNPNEISGFGLDGYISGATVFADANNNGVLDAGEVHTTTAADGSFTLSGGGGPLVMFGGTDISTNLTFNGVLTAPEGSTVVTPLTTLIVAIITAPGSTISVADAASQVAAAFGLDPTKTLTTFDPVAAAISGDSSASAILSAGIQVQSTVAQVSAVGRSADAVFSAIASTVAASTTTVDLSAPSTVHDIVSNSGVSDDAASAVAAVVAAANGSIQLAGGDVTALAQAAVVAQGAATTQLATTDFTDPAQVDALHQTFVTDLSTQVSNAIVGVTGLALVGTLGADVLTGGAGNDAIDGLDGNDAISGGGGNDQLYGSAGNDVLTGDAGDDRIDGGAGFDKANYSDAAAGVAIDLTAGTAQGITAGDAANVGNDTLVSIEGVIGSDFADTFSAVGFNGSTGLPGRPSGFDDFEGKGGDDTINGTVNASGEILTRISYLSAAAAVTVDLVAGTGHGTAAGDAAHVGNDTFTNVNSIVGSAYDDTLLGGNNPNGTFEQFEGRAGNDLIDGRGGYDFATYSNDPTTTTGITVHLAAGTVTGDATVGTDTLRSVEAVRGTNFADVYDATGFNGASTNAGSYTTFNNFDGQGGNDTIIGNGATRIQYSQSLDGVTVDIALGTAHGTAAGDVANVGTDTFTGVNAVMGSMFADTLLGSGINENFQGLAGNDFIDGRGGFDTAQYNNLTYVTGAITVDMASGVVTGDASNGTDTLRSVEGIQGTFFDDIYVATGYGVAGTLNIGNTGTFNQFEGAGGNDTITGSGNTRIGYFNATAGVTVVFTGSGSGVADGDTSVGHDTFTGVNSATGSAFADTLIGDGNSNTLNGGGGNDTIDGGGGTDLAVFTGARGSGYNVLFNTPSAGQVQVQDTVAGRDGTDILTNIEVLQFTDQSVLIASGTSGAPIDISDNRLSFGATTNAFNTLTGPNNDFLKIGFSLSGHLINLGAGTGDTVILGQTGFYNLNLLNVENLVGSAGIDTVNLLTTGTTLSVTGVENVNANDFSGAATNDTLTLTNNVSGLTVNLAQGNNTLNLAAGANSFTSISNVQHINGSAGDDTLTVFNGFFENGGNPIVDLGAGNNTLNFGGGGVTFTALNIQYFNGNSLDNFVTLNNNVSGMSIDLGDGNNDGLSLANGVNSISAYNIETINGSDFGAISSDDTLTFLNDVNVSFLNLGNGTNTLNLAAGTNTFGYIDNVKYVNGSASDDTLTLTGNLYSTDNNPVVDLGAGNNTINIAFNYQNLTALNIQNINGNSDDNTLSLHNNVSGISIDLGGGTDMLIIANGVNSLSVSNIENIQGGDFDIANPSDDTLTLLNNVNGLLVNLGYGTNTLNLAAGSNSFGDLWGINLVNGSSSDDTLTIQGNASNTIDLSDGNDSLILGNGFNNVTVRNIENVVGGTNNDNINIADLTGTVTVTGGLGNDFISLGGSHDNIRFTSAADSAAGGGADTVANFDVVNDAFVLDHVAGLASAVHFVSNGVFDGTPAAHQSEARLVGNLVQIDVDGDGQIGAGDMEIYLNGLNGSLTDANFVTTGVDHAPTDIMLSAATVAENSANGIVVGSLSAIDPDAGDSATFSLTNNAGGLFAIANGNLVVNGPLDYESASSQQVTVRVTDSGGLTYDKNFTIAVTNVNEAPTDISVSNAAVQQGTAGGTVVGALSAIDPDAGDIATFSLVDGAGGQFDVAGGNIVVAGPLAIGAQQVIVRATDAGGLTFDKTIMIDVNANAPIVGDAGPNTLIGTPGDDLIQGLGGNDRLQGLGGNDVLDGGDGVDRAVYTDATGPVTVNLAAGTASGAGVGTDTLVNIEGAVGSDFSDTFDATGFTGSSGLPGVAAGQSAFEGGGGDDVIIGRVNDLDQAVTRVEYLGASAAVTVDLAAATGQGTAAGDIANVGHDTFTNIQGVFGSAYDDTLFGSDNANFTYEVFEGRGGDDYIDGRGGYDIVTYNNDPVTASGITVNLAVGTVTGDASVGTDTLRNVEALRGTNFHDVYDATGYGVAGALNVSTTNGNFNDFAGAGGDDLIIGNGNTRLNYSIALAAVTVDLQTTAGTAVTVAGSATGATEGTDTFTGVNAVQASMFGDTLLGSSFNNTFTGLGGDDYIDGRGGFDTAVYNHLNTVTSGVTVNMAAGTATGDASIGSDTLRNIEGIQGTGYADTYDATGYGVAGALNVSTSNGNFNQFEGLGGDDTITGNGNTRVLYSNATGGVTVTIGDGGAGSASGDASTGHDTFNGGVNAAIGSNFDDLYDASGFNTGFFNSFQGNGGNDTIIGNGNTAAQYSNATSGVAITIGASGAGTASGDASVGTDTFVSGVNSALGGNLADSYDASGYVGFNSFQGQGGNDVITGNGNTQIQLSSASAGVSVNLTTGTVTGDASVGTDTITGGVSSVSGSNFNDTIIGSNGADFLLGNGGNDIIDGRGGNDNLTGGAGVDTFVFASGGGSDFVSDFNHGQGDRIDVTGVAGVYSLADIQSHATQQGPNTVIDFGGGDAITLQNVTLSNLVAGDFVFSTAITGTSAADVLVGTSQANLILGLDGNDRLQGLGGDDILDGGQGFDRAIYTDATGGITVDLAAGTVSGPGVGSDTLVNIEGIVGSDLADTYTAAGFIGDAGLVGTPFGFNEFEGRGGDDTITGTVNASGEILGRASYASATAAVTVDLAAGTADGDISVGHDTLANINAVTGSAFDDVLQGGNNPNGTFEQYEGRSGNDLIDGRGGYDFAIYNLDSATATGITVNLAAGIVTGDASIGTDTLRSVEAVRGTNFADVYDATGFSGGSTNAGSSGTFNNFEGMGGDDTITGNGNTRLQFSQALDGVTVDLAAGVSQGTAAGDIAQIGTDTFSGVNAVMGSMFADTLLGTGGNEQFQGLAGNDSIDGRGGFDTAQYSNLTFTTGGISVDMASGTVTGDASTGTDTLRSIEGVQGTIFADTYVATGYGQAGALNVSDSNGNFNQFEGLGGDDSITGNGNTRVIYANATGGVTIDLQAGTAAGDASVGNDSFIGVNSANGSNFTDTYDATGFTGTSAAGSFGTFNAFLGMGGNDVITGNGNTQIQYNNATAGVSVDLTAGIATGDASVGTDTIIGGVQSVQGSNFNDTLAGSSASEFLNGNGGNDIIDGRGGSDTMTGGAGADTFVFATGDGSDFITDFNHGQGDRIDLTGVAGIYSLLDIQSHAQQLGPNTFIDFGGGNTITLQNVTLSNLVAGDFVFPTGITGTPAADVLVGTSQADLIFGLDGNDRLQGLDGDDRLDGGQGVDRAIYSDATGGVTVNLAAGTASGAGVGNDTLVGIEGIVGSDFADTFNAAGFNGSAGVPGVTTGQNDFEGRGGDDVIIGDMNTLGQAVTRISYLGATSAVTVDIAAGTADGDASVGHDTFSNISTVWGSASNDTFYGSDNASFTYETYEGRGGDDYIDGRGGYDQVTYNNDPTTTSGIVVHLAAGTVTGDATVGTDTIRNVEAARGTAFDDVFDATGYGLAGALNVSTTNGNFNDFGGAGGNDTIIGNGNTRLNYQIAAASVSVDLETSAGTAITVAGSATGTTEGTDTFTGVNAVQGSMFGDTLLGSSFNNTLTGLGGDDFIDGRGGFDTASYNSLSTVTGGLSVNMAAGTATGDASIGTDTLRNIEGIQGTMLADSYDATGYGLAGAVNVSTSNGNFNQFEGLGGDDTITGNGNTRVIYANSTAGVTITLGADGAGSAHGTAAGDAAHVGNDTFTGGVNGVTGSNFADVFDASGFTAGFYNAFQGQGGDDVIIGNGSTQIQFGNATSGVTIDLAAGTADGDGSTGHDTISGVSNVSGSNFGDTIIGSNGDDQLFGNGGNDVLNGGAGNDFLSGGAGADTFVYASGYGTDTIIDFNRGEGDHIDLTGVAGIFSLADVQSHASQQGLNTLIDFGNGDTITLANIAVESLVAGDFAFQTGIIGTSAADVLVGTSQADVILGLGGNDRLQGLAGNDTLDGGAGFDRAIYTDATAGITASFAAGTASGAGVGNDTLISIEGIVGSAFADNLTAAGFVGDSGVAGTPVGFNEIEGGGGDDTITSAVNSQGALLTRISYVNASSAVVVDLSMHSATGGDGTDTLIGSGFAGIVGSAFADTLVGTANAAGTVEVLEGRAGNDTLNGGAGFDRADYAQDPAAVGGITVNLAAGTVMGDAATVGTDTLISIESVRGSNAADTFNAGGFTGTSINAGSNGTFNEFNGMGGNDTINGNGNTRVTYINATGGVQVDLQTGATPGTGTADGDASTGHDTFNGVNAIQASMFDDTLYGSNSTAGTETFYGGAGNDYIDGRGGFDLATYNNIYFSTGAVTVNMGAGTATGDASVGSDTLRSIEAVQGTNFNDTFDASTFGTAGALNIGNNGIFSQFEGIGGNDTITGNGNTRVIYSSATAGVTINMGAGTASGDASVGTDTFTGVNSATGSASADTYNAVGFVDTGTFSSGTFNLFEGLAGNDDITGNGNTRVAYSQAAAGVTVNLATGVVSGAAGADVIHGGVNSVQGSNFNDTLTGGSGNELFFGAGGGDTINAGGGNDQITGQGGNDTIDGGAGSDVVFFTGIQSQYTINPGTPGAGQTQVVDSQGAARDGTDVLTNVEVVQFSDAALLLSSGTLGSPIDISVTNLNFNTPLVGTTGDDFLAVGGNIFGHQIDLGAGIDTVILANAGGYTLNLLNVDNLVGSSGNDFVNLSNNAIGLSVDLGDGTDNLNLANGINSLTVSNVENISGADFSGSSDDTLTLLNNVSGLSVNLANGHNTLNLTGGSNTLNDVFNANSIHGTGGTDVLSITGFLGTNNFDVVIDLGGGDDTLNIAQLTASLNLVGVEHVNGNSQNNFFGFEDNVLGISVDLGDGIDNLSLANGTNSLSVVNVENIGGSDFGSPTPSDDNLTLLNDVSGVTVNLGDGSNTLNLAAGSNTFDNLWNIDHVNGTSSNDTLTIQGNGTGNTIDLGDGTDTLNINGGSGGLTVANVETINGSANYDNFTISNAPSGSTTVTAGAGADAIVASAGQDTFRFTSVADSTTNGQNDVVTNFDASHDTFTFSGITVAGNSIQYVDTGAFAGGNQASAHLEHQGPGNDLLQIDINGDGSMTEADMQISLTNLTGILNNGNFLLT